MADGGLIVPPATDHRLTSIVTVANFSGMDSIADQPASEYHRAPKLAGQAPWLLRQWSASSMNRAVSRASEAFISRRHLALSGLIIVTLVLGDPTSAFAQVLRWRGDIVVPPEVHAGTIVVEPATTIRCTADSSLRIFAQSVEFHGEVTIVCRGRDGDVGPDAAAPTQSDWCTAGVADFRNAMPENGAPGGAGGAAHDGGHVLVFAERLVFHPGAEVVVDNAPGSPGRGGAGHRGQHIVRRQSGADCDHGTNLRDEAEGRRGADGPPGEPGVRGQVVIDATTTQGVSVVRRVNEGSLGERIERARAASGALVRALEGAAASEPALRNATMDALRAWRENPENVRPLMGDGLFTAVTIPDRGGRLGGRFGATIEQQRFQETLMAVIVAVVGDTTITDIMRERRVGPASQHHVGLALDLRSHGLTLIARLQRAMALSETLGANFTILVESPSPDGSVQTNFRFQDGAVSVEHGPRGADHPTRHATGPHDHVQLARGIAVPPDPRTLFPRALASRLPAPRASHSDLAGRAGLSWRVRVTDTSIEIDGPFLLATHPPAQSPGPSGAPGSSGRTPVHELRYGPPLPSGGSGGAGREGHQPAQPGTRQQGPRQDSPRQDSPRQGSPRERQQRDPPGPA